jgi:hypothetical protein
MGLVPLMSLSISLTRISLRHPQLLLPSWEARRSVSDPWDIQAPPPVFVSSIEDDLFYQGKGVS